MAEAKLRQVTWNIPKELYTRFQELHKWSMDKNFAGIPASERDFAILMLDDAVSRGEKIQRTYDRANRLIIEPDGSNIFMPGR